MARPVRISRMDAAPLDARTKELVPGVGPNPYDAGKSGFNVANFNCAKYDSEIRAEGPNDCPMLKCHDEKDCSASKRSNDRLREAARAIRKLWTANWIGFIPQPLRRFTDVF